MKAPRGQSLRRTSLMHAPARFDAPPRSYLGALLLFACALSSALRAEAQAAAASGHTAIAYANTEADSATADANLGKGDTLRAGEREHEGFFLRLSAGPGAARTRYEERVDGTNVSDVASSGLTGIVEVAAGGRVVENLIVHGNLIYTRYDSPTRLVDGAKDAGTPVTASAVMLGAGSSYYFMPYNVFLSGALGLAWQIEQRPGGEVDGNTGFFVALAAGKEWWVGRGEWGLGATLRGSFATGEVDIAGLRTTSRLGTLTLAFCATFN